MPKPGTTNILRFAIGGVVTIALVSLALNSVSTEHFVQALSQLSIPSALVALLSYLAVTAARAARFRSAGAKLSFAEAMTISAVHAALLRVMPLRSGELAYGILLRKQGGGGFTDGLASIVMLRVLDLAAVLPLAAGVVALLLVGPENSWTAVILGLSGLALVGVFFAMRPFSRWLSQRFSSSSGRRKKFAKFVTSIADTYNIPLSAQFSLLGWTIVIWGLVLIWFHFILSSLGMVDSWNNGLIASVSGISGSIIPVSLIGTFGPMESGFALGLKAGGVEQGTAIAGAILASAMTFLCNWIVALPAWLILAFDLQPQKSDSKLPTMRVYNFVLWAGFSLVAALIMLYRWPYGFETNDQFQYLLLPYQSIYEDFLLGDWFTWQTTHYHIVFSKVIQGIHAVFGENGMPSAVFFLHFATLVGIGAGLLSITRAAKWSTGAAAFAVVVVSFVRHEGIGGALINHGVLLPADMAIPPFLFSIASWIRGRPLQAGLWLGLSGLLHPNYAVLGPLVLGIASLPSLAKKEWKSTLWMAGGFLFIAWPNLLVILNSFLGASFDPQALDLLFSVRSPHHYHPDLWKRLDVWFFALLLATGIGTWFRCYHQQISRRLLVIMGVIIGLQVVAGVGSSFDIPPLIRLFLWRLSSTLLLLLAAAAGQSFVVELRRKSVTGIAYSAIAIVAIAAFSLGGRLQALGEQTFIGAGIIIPLIPVLAAVSFLSLRKDSWPKYVISICLLSAAFWLGGMSVTGGNKPGTPALNWERGLERWQKSYPIRIHPKKHRSKKSSMYAWIQKNVEPDATFLIPPGLSEFRLQARRGVYIDWKCFPMKPNEMLEWSRRILLTMGTKKIEATGYALPRLADKLYYRRSLNDLASLARDEGISHVVTLTNKKFNSTEGISRIATYGSLSVYRIQSLYADSHFDNTDRFDFSYLAPETKRNEKQNE